MGRIFPAVARGLVPLEAGGACLALSDEHFHHLCANGKLTIAPSYRGANAPSRGSAHKMGFGARWAGGSFAAASQCLQLFLYVFTEMTAKGFSLKQRQLNLEFKNGVS